MNKSRLLVAPLLLIALIIGCRPSVVTMTNRAKFDYVVAEADAGYSLKMSALYGHVNNTTLLNNGGVIDTVMVKSLLDSIVCDTLTSLISSEVNLDEYYKAHSQYLRRHHDFMIGQYLDREIYSKVMLDSQEIVDYYYSRPDLFTVREQGLYNQILVTVGGLLKGPDSAKYKSYTEEQMEQEAADYAARIRAQIDSGEAFLEAARQYSHDTTTGKDGGRIGWVARDTYQHPFDSVAFAMRKGDIADPFKDSQGWHILYCGGHYENEVPPIEARMYSSAKKSLRNDRVNALGKVLTDSLFQDISLTYNEELLDTNLFLVDGVEWVAVVNGQDTIRCDEARSAELSVRRERNIENTDADLKKEMYLVLARRYRVVQAARDTGIDQLPEVVENERGLYRKYTKAILDRQRYPREYKPTEAEIERYYERNKEEFRVRKPLTVQHIITQDSVFGEFLRDQAMSGVDFLELAQQHYPGEEAIRVVLANLGEIGPGDVPEKFWEAAMLIPEGEVTHPVKTEYGYHIIKVLKKRETMKLDRARSTILTLLREKHIHSVFAQNRDQLFERFNVRFPGKLYPIHLKPLNLRMFER